MTLIYDLLVSLWVMTVSTEPMPDYIIEAFNWVSFGFMIFVVFIPVIGIWLVIRVIRSVAGGGNYDAD